MTTKVQIRLEITALADAGASISSLINDAMAELINRIEFRTGDIKQGRVLDVSYDYKNSSVVIDLFQLRTETGAR